MYPDAENEDLTIPNALILGNYILDYNSSAEARLILHSEVTISYDVSWQKVHELLIEAAKKTNGIMAEPPPFVLQKGLKDYYVSYEINAYTEQPNQMPRIYSELHHNIQDCFFAADVEIMSPAYHALRNGNPTAIPQQYRKE